MREMDLFCIMEIAVKLLEYIFQVNPNAELYAKVKRGAKNNPFWFKIGLKVSEDRDYFYF